MFKTRQNGSAIQFLNCFFPHCWDSLYVHVKNHHLYISDLTSYSHDALYLLLHSTAQLLEDFSGD